MYSSKCFSNWCYIINQKHTYVIPVESKFILKLHLVVLAQVCADGTDAGSYRYPIHTYESSILGHCKEFG